MFSNGRFPDGMNHEAMKVMPRLLRWKHQNTGYLPKKTAGPGEPNSRERSYVLQMAEPQVQVGQDHWS